MEEFFDNFSISRERVERGRLAINTRNAGHTEQLERYKNTLEKQWQRERSFLQFKQNKFLSRQEKVLGKTFHSDKSKREHKKIELPKLKPNGLETSPHTERKMSDSKLSAFNSPEVEKETRRVLSAGEKRIRYFTPQIKQKQIEGPVLSNVEWALGSSVKQKEQQQECDDEESVSVMAFERIQTEHVCEENQRKENEERETEGKRAISAKGVEIPQVQALTESEGNPNESRLQPERLLVTRESLSLQEITRQKSFKGSGSCHDSSNKEELKKPKKTPSKRKHKTHKGKPQPIVKSSSLPDVRTKSSHKLAIARPLKPAGKSQHENLTLPRVKRSSTEVKSKGSVNLSVVCRVIRIKNTLTKKKKSKKSHDENTVKKDEEISPELWETLKSCRYLRIANKTAGMACELAI